jgi:hypothetical protein
MKTITTALLATVAMACVTPPMPDLPNTQPSDAILLDGQWRGEFRSDDGQRFGDMSFSLQVRNDTARGDVLLLPMEYTPVPAGVSVPLRAEARAPVDAAANFVSVREGVFVGTMPSYFDSRRLTTVQLTFFGRLTRWDVMEGTYVVLGPSRVEERGTWRVIRGN